MKENSMPVPFSQMVAELPGRIIDHGLGERCDFTPNCTGAKDDRYTIDGRSVCPDCYSGAFGQEIDEHPFAHCPVHD